MFAAIDVSQAQCFMPADKERILGDIVNGSTTALRPSTRASNCSSCCSHRSSRQTSTASGTAHRPAARTWTLHLVQQWAALEDEAPGSRKLCIPAGAATGKSTISAALLRHGDTAELVSTSLFLKYNDQQRLDMVEAVKSLAHQLSER